MTVTQSSLDGFFKERYGQLIEGLDSSGNAVIASRVKFAEGEKIGDSYHEPVRLGRPMGWTFAGASLAGTAYTLNGARSGLTKDASVDGSSFVLQEQVAYDVASRAASSMQAFGRVFDDIVEAMQESSILARELSLLYGQDDLGTIESITTVGAGTEDITLTKASSSAAVWWQMYGGAIDCYTAAGGTQRNSNALIAVSKVDLDSNGKIVVTVTGNTTDLAACVAGDVLMPRGADGEQMVGLAKVAKNTGSIYGISASTYPLWKATSYDAGSAAATVATFMHALKANTLKCGPGRKSVLVSTATWIDLNNNTTVLQRFLDSKQKAGVEFGTDSIEIEQGKTRLEIVEHPLMKEGEAYVVDFRKHKRIGSRDHSWGIGAPGQNERFFQELSTSAGFELRCYWDQGHLCRHPGSVTRIHSIVNSV